MQTPQRLTFGAAALGLGLVACSGSQSKDPEPAPTQDMPSVRALWYEPGPNWQAGQPPEAQDLAEHLSYVGGLFQDGTLVANGLLPLEGKGLYLLNVKTTAGVDDFVARDPAVAKGVLKQHAVEQWFLAMEGLGVKVESTMEFFVLDYLPGKSWQSGKPLVEQDIGEHMSYVGELFKKQQLLAGGPVDVDQGRYLVVAADQSAAQALVDADPGVSSQLFRVDIRQWHPAQRQSLTAR